MIYFLYGSDTYRSRKKVREITDRFRTVSSGESPIVMVLPEFTLPEIRAAAETGSLFRAKRLLVLEEPGGATADVLAYLTSKAPRFAAGDDVVVLWDREVKSDAPFLQTMKEHAVKAQEFTFLRTADAARLLEDEMKARAISLSMKDTQKIITAAAGSSWRLIQLLEKHALGGGVDTLPILQDGRRLLFSFTDACGQRNRTDAWRILQTLAGLGITADQVFWALLGYARTLIRIGSLAENGTPHAELAREAGVHPFVAKKALLHAGSFTERERIQMYQRLSELDFQTKQGRGDRALGLERFVLTL